MNISSISFCGSNNGTYRTNRSSHTSASTNCKFAENANMDRAHLRNGTGFDSYEPSTKGVQKKHTQKKQKFNPYKAAVLGYAALKVMQMLAGQVGQPEQVVDIQARRGDDLNKYAVVYDVPVESLMAYNELESTLLPYDMQISIPSAYEHPIVDEMEELQDDLYSNRLDDEERAEIIDEMADLAEIQQMQSEIATMCTDGEFVYFTITLPRGDEATDIQKKYDGRINVETFKDIYGIKDGVIKDNNNNISFTWGLGEYGGYMDWTTASLKNGDTIKVPVSAVTMKQVNVSD